jgi:EAL domain-containing protein (putative c-di-GMP-specific phosphodiesterase class I)/PleD family two-component response regulator
MNQDIWAATDPAPLGETYATAARSPLLDAKVMMVDDEPLMTDLIQTHLEDEGYRNFVVTNDPLRALALLKRESPGVLLLDLMMPQLSGFELLTAIRADRSLRYTPVIVLTAASGADAKLRALQLGATDFLSKPVDSSELVLRVRNTLAFHQYHDRLVNFDAVTGLPNARPFERGMDEMLARREVVGGTVALFSITVPEVRRLRESVEQEAADALARELARRVAELARSESVPSLAATSSERAPRVARLGADEFGLLLEGLADADAVEAVAKRLLASLAEPVVVGSHDLAPGAWIGVSMSPADGLTAERLRKAADLAATHASQYGSAQYQFASAELQARSYERLKLGSQLRGAAARGELRLHYQPKIDAASRRIVGAEALVRWQHPEHGLMAPGRFIPLAEELGLIGVIGSWVMERACHDAAGWMRAGLPPLKVAVNVAEPQFASGGLCDELRRALSDSGLPAHQLVIELTESMLMVDVDAALALMHELKALGVTLSIDDFGTGYSSLSYLKRLPLDELKIDRSFIVDLPGEAGDVAIVSAVIDLGHSLGMSVTAEGVETAAQRDCLAALGCDQFQGFLFSKPIPVEQLVQWCSAPPSATSAATAWSPVHPTAT